MLNFKPLTGAESLPLYILADKLRTQGTAGFYILAILAIAILIALIALVEMVTLQLLRWGNTRQSMRASLAMNLVSSLVVIFLIVLFPQPRLSHLWIAWFILVGIEGAVLTYIRPETPRYNWFAAAVANLASYLLLIQPAFLFRG
jgi:hypothetical protein